MGYRTGQSGDAAPARHTTSRFIGLVVVLVLALVHTPPALAQDTNYPTRPIRIVVPTAPGAGSDLSARLIALRLGERWSRPVVVENRAGAGTIIGTEIVARAPADGYVLLMAPGAFSTLPATYRKLPFDARRDFVPITQAVATPNLIVAHPSLPARTVKELIALAKARPGEILYGSAGHGTQPHLTMELFLMMAGVRMGHVAYKGGAPGITDLVAGQIALMTSASLSLLIPHVRANRLRGLAVTTATRHHALPDVPTVSESGLPGYESVQWAGLLAPAGTPREVVSRLHRESTAILRAPENRERLRADGSEVVASSPEEFGALIQGEIVKWTKVVQAAGIQPE